MAKSDWHFPREDFANKIFKLLIEGPGSAISMFGPRRTGKSEFLQEDLAPLADAMGHRVIYVSMWQSLDEPIASLLHAFDLELRGGKLSDRIAAVIGDYLPKVTIKDPVTGSDVEFDTANRTKNTQINPVLLLEQYCDRLADEDKPTLLLFDEFQELARNNNTASIIAGLRTSLDIRKKGIVSVFTGSSQDGLKKVFNAKEAPFYRFATQMSLPALDEAFVDHQLEVFQSIAKREINREDALSVFEKIEQNPEYFKDWLTALMAEPSLTPDDAIDHVLNELGEKFGFDRKWKELKPLQRAVLRLLAMDTVKLYSDESIEMLEGLTSNGKPSSSDIQNAIRRLSRNNIIENPDKVWCISDTLLKLWVKERSESDFHG